MTALWLLGACMVLGMLAARFLQPPPGLAQSLNWWVINVALPSIVLSLIPRLHFDWHLWFLAASQWLVIAGAWLLFATLGARFRWPRTRIGAVILTCGFGNTSFIGFPMIEALRSKEDLAYAVVADQLGCFLSASVIGITVAALYSGGEPDVRQIARKVLLFPAFLALVGGCVVGALGGWPPVADEILTRLGSTLTPLALFSVGLQFSLHLTRDQLGAVAAGLSWKLLLAPLLVYGLGHAFGIEGPTLVIAVLESAMAPMISAAIIANEYGLEPRLANTILSAGILIGMVTVPVANALL
jgi:predicted permease